MAETLAPHLSPEVSLRLVSRRRDKLWRMAEMLWAVWRYGRAEQPVLIDTYSSLNFWYAVACGGLCHLLGGRYLCVLHGGNLPDRLRRNPKWCRLLFGRAWRLVAPSGYLQAAFRAHGYEAEVIPNPIPIENYPFRLRKKLRPRLLWVRAFSAIYNPQMAIRVLHRLSARYPEASLCMVGPDKDGSMAECRALARRLGVADRVCFTGLLPKAEWIALSADYDIFLNTTNVDNTPVSVIEAMALGLPVVCTDAGGLPWLVEDGVTGMIVPCGDEKGMVEQVRNLLNDGHLAEKLSRNGRLQAEKFAMQEVVTAWKDLLANQ